MAELRQHGTGVKSLITTSSAGLARKVKAGKKKSYSFFISLGDAGMFSWRTLKETLTFRIEWKELFRQCYEIGNRSFWLVAVTGFIMGLVLTIQSRPILVKFGAESWLPSMVSISLIREMGPVITALIVAGRVGSGIGAEIGSMKVTEQIDAMEVSGAEPFNYLVVTRVLAATLMMPLLVIFSDFMGLTGCYLGANIKGEINLFLFFTSAFEPVQFTDVFPATIKTFLFGAVVGLVGCYKGYNAAMGTASVGKAANSAVVISSLLIFIVDVIAVQLTDLLYIK